MEGLYRRPSGVYFARLAVPDRLRAAVGQTELISTTGVRDLALARIIGGELLAQWRRRFFDLDRLHLSMDIDIARLTAGSPTLAAGSGTLPLAGAASASGLGEESLLREASTGKLNLFVRLKRCQGMRVPFDALDQNPEGGWDVPPPDRMPSQAVAETFTGVVQVLDGPDVATHLLAGDAFEAVLFGVLGDVARGFAPDEVEALGRTSIELLASEVEALRRRTAALVTPEQIALVEAERAARPLPGFKNGQRPLRESIIPFLSDHTQPRGAEQTRRVQGACELFLELMGADLRGADLTRDEIRRFRDVVLPTVPARENKIRLTHKTSSVTMSIKAIEGSNWPRMSAEEQVKRMGWLAGWLEWLGREGWAEAGLPAGLVGGGKAGRNATTRRRKTKDQDRRDAFTNAELALIFSATWFKTGRGELTAAGTYRTWSPVKTWLPLIGLLTGARIGEITQLQLSDIWCNEHGVWLIDVIDGSEDDDDGAAARKKLKNVNARRQIPVHSQLLRLGLIEWRDALAAAGHRRLFPELKHDQEKGYGKAMTKWFSGYLRGLGLQRDGRKVFHSFRHTMSTRLENDLVAPLAVTKQILGHERGDSTTVNTYRKDMEATGPESPLVRQIEAVSYVFIAQIAVFDAGAGLQATADALARKNRGRGAEAD